MLGFPYESILKLYERTLFKIKKISSISKFLLSPLLKSAPLDLVGPRPLFFSTFLMKCVSSSLVSAQLNLHPATKVNFRI